MTRRLKFLTLTLSMVLCVAVMTVGVFAATTASLGITNNVTFSAADQVDATITYSTVGAATELTDEVAAEFNIGDSNTTAEKTLALTDMAMASNSTDTAQTLTITFTVTNDSTTDKLNVAWTQAAATTATNCALTGTATTAGSVEVDAGATTDITLIWTVTDNMDEGGAQGQLDSGFTITLTPVAAE